MFANLFLLFFGSGTFALPWGFKHAGMLGGTLGIVGVALATYLTVSMLVRAKRLQQRRLAGVGGADELQHTLSYAAVAAHALGSPCTSVVVQAATALSAVGGCAGFLTFAAGLLLPMVRRAAASAATRSATDLAGDTAANAAAGAAGAVSVASAVMAGGRTSVAAAAAAAAAAVAERAAALDDRAFLLWLLPCIVLLAWVRSFRGLGLLSVWARSACVLVSTWALVRKLKTILLMHRPSATFYSASPQSPSSWTAGFASVSPEPMISVLKNVRMHSGGFLRV
jgi:hypothetical protein